MGKKDATGSYHSTPVDQYRKQIGKQDYKKVKKEMKSSRTKSDLKKSSSPIRDTLMILSAVIMLVLAIYFGLFSYLNKDPS